MKATLRYSFLFPAIAGVSLMLSMSTTQAIDVPSTGVPVRPNCGIGIKHHREATTSTTTVRCNLALIPGTSIPVGISWDCTVSRVFKPARQECLEGAGTFTGCHTDQVDGYSETGGGCPAIVIPFLYECRELDRQTHRNDGEIADGSGSCLRGRE